MRANLKDGDVIIHSSKLNKFPAIFFDKDLLHVFIADQPGPGVDTIAPATQQILGMVSQEDIKTAVGNTDRIWFIIYAQYNQEYLQADEPTQPDPSSLTAPYSPIEIRYK
jgi:hypothetical protein